MTKSVALVGASWFVLAVVACMPQQPPPGSAGPGYNAAGGGGGWGGGGGGGGGGGCAAMCGRFQECSLLEAGVETCVTECEYALQNGPDTTAQYAAASCDELAAAKQEAAALRAPAGGGGGYGGYGGGGNGNGCRASHASQPVQDCPANQECCNSHCYTRGMCALPTGR